MEWTDHSISNGLLRHGLNAGFLSNACLLFALLDICEWTFAIPSLFAEVIARPMVAGWTCAAAPVVESEGKRRPEKRRNTKFRTGNLSCSTATVVG